MRFIYMPANFYVTLMSLFSYYFLQRQTSLHYRPLIVQRLVFIIYFSRLYVEIRFLADMKRNHQNTAGRFLLLLFIRILNFVDLRSSLVKLGQLDILLRVLACARLFLNKQLGFKGIVNLLTPATAQRFSAELRMSDIRVAMDTLKNCGI